MFIQMEVPKYQWILYFGLVWMVRFTFDEVKNSPPSSYRSHRRINLQKTHFK